jgi:hypothetical protein
LRMRRQVRIFFARIRHGAGKTPQSRDGENSRENLLPIAIYPA